MPTVRQQIAAAAQELFLRDGIDGVSMRKVAERVGVSAPSIYRHFRNKDELLTEIVRTGLGVFEGHLRPAFDRPTPFERISRMIDAYREFAIEQPHYFDCAFLSPVGSVDELSVELERDDSPTFRAAVAELRACMDEGTLRPDDPVEVAATLWAHAHGLVVLFRLGRLGGDVDAFRLFFRRSIGRLLDGLRP